MRKCIVIILTFAVLILGLSGCSPQTVETTPGLDGSTICEIYYFDSVNQTIKPEIMSLEGEKQGEKIRDAYNKMAGIVKSEEKRSVVPEGLEINSVKIDSGMLDIDFNAVYNTMSMGDKLTFKSAVVYTFTSLDFIDYVRITVDGSPLKMTNGQSVGNIGREDILMDGNISAEPTNYEILTLYFKNSDGSRLGTEIREVEVNPNQPIERYVVEQLIKGPESDSLKNVIPSDTKIRDISTADGICYVDLSSEFVTKQSGTEKDGIAAVYSIVNSLGEMETVNKVQFLIEGEKVDDYRHIMDLSKSVEPNYDITFE